MEQLRLNGIVSLEITGECNSNDGMMLVLSKILPNLQEINLSNTGFGYQAFILHLFSKNCIRLEKVTWNNINQSMIILGSNLRFAKNLKEIYMDDCVFYQHCNPLPATVFFFHGCSKVLERVSIRNAKYIIHRLGSTPEHVPQKALIKFVQNSPLSLRWFRSSLTNENMIMLRSERPGIEFLN